MWSLECEGRFGGIKRDRYGWNALEIAAVIARPEPDPLHFGGNPICRCFAGGRAGTAPLEGVISDCPVTRGQIGGADGGSRSRMGWVLRTGG